MSLLLLFTGGGGGGATPSGSIAATAPASTASLTATGAPTEASIAATAPAATASVVAAGGPVTSTIAGTAPAARAAVLATSGTEAATGWQVRAVTDVGAVINLLGGINVLRVPRSVNAQESAELSVATLHDDTEYLDLFEYEIQLWLDGGDGKGNTDRPYFWGRPARLDATREGDIDELAVVCEGLFSYFFDEVVGGEKVNHIISPHEESAAVGNSPTDWIATSKIEDVAVVDNNAEFWQQAKAIQVNNSEPGQDAYIYQRYTVPAELDKVPFAAAAVGYVADDQGGAPAYGGPALQERGLMIMRIDGTTEEPLGAPKIARIDDDTPRNQPVRLQTDEILPEAGDIIDVRLYAPDAWTAWRWAGLFDGRAVEADRVDKSVAVQILGTHAQDTSIGHQNYRINFDAPSLSESGSWRWPWWRRDNIGEQLLDLADTFEYVMHITHQYRTLRVRRQVGITHPDVLSKTDFVGWGLGMETASAASRVYRQGEGSGIARDEYRVTDTTGLRGNVREALTFGSPGESLAQLRDNASEHLNKVKNVTKLPRARIVGDLAKKIRPGDTVTVNLDHGWAQFSGAARAMHVDFDGVAKTAMLELEPA